MNILMLGWELPPHNSGGLGVACYEISKGLSAQGLVVDFVVPYTAKHDITHFDVHHATTLRPGAPSLPGAYSFGGCTCSDTTCTHSAYDPTPLGIQKRYTDYVVQFVKQKTPHIIHAHDWLTFDAGVQAKILTGKPLIAHVHATEFDRAGGNNGNPIIHDIEYNGLMMADKIIAVSSITKTIIMERYGIPGDKIEVIHNSIDISTMSYDVSEQQTFVYLEEMKKRGYTIAVSLSRLSLQKGLNFLLEAAAKALSKNEKMLFLIAGSGEQRDELIELSADLGIADKVLFTGFIRGKAWRDAYRIGDMFIMSSISEPFGLTALEAAGYHNAVLLTKQSGASEVMKNVLRFDFWDTTKLADNMVAISQLPVLQQELAQNAYKEFQQFSWDSAVKKCTAVYESHVNQGIPA